MVYALQIVLVGKHYYFHFEYFSCQITVIINFFIDATTTIQTHSRDRMTAYTDLYIYIYKY